MLEKFIRLGEKIISCDANCDGVIGRVERINKGKIPRVLVLCTLNGKITNKKAKIGVFGINPGHLLPFENLYYRKVLENAKNDYCRAFEEIHDNWVSEFFGFAVDGESDEKERPSKLSYLKYFINTKKFLSEIKDVIGLEDDDTILWGEVVYCERVNDDKLPEQTKLNCARKFMGKVIDFVEGELIICLGEDAYEFMRAIKNGKKRNIDDTRQKLKNKKILGIYHPSGSRVFYRYFETRKEGEERENITKRKIKMEVKSKIEEFIRGTEPYGFLRCQNDLVKIGRK